jgi:hypothetical protein
MDRQRTIRRITTYFPSVDSHKFIEILARELTLFLAKDIHSVLRETKKQPKQSIVDRVMRVVEWMNTATNLTVVQALACGHAAKLIDKLMRQEAPFAVQFEHIALLLEWVTDRPREEIDARNDGRPSTPLSPGMGIGTFHASDKSGTTAAEGTASAPLTPSGGAFVEKEEVDERIYMLERKLSQELHARTAVEQQHMRELKELKKQMKGLEAVNQIFSGSSATGGLLGAQSAESIHKTIGEHLTAQAAQQNQQGEVLRELALRMELLIEDNNLRTPEGVQVSGGTGGSGIYNSDKGAAPLGPWVNAKTSVTADLVTEPPLAPTAPTSASTADTTANSNHSSGRNDSSRPVSAGPGRDSMDGIDETNVAIDTGGCCVLM